MLVMQNRHVQSLKWFFIRVSSIFMWHGRIATIIIWCEKDVRSQSCPTLLDLMDCSTPGLLIPHHLMEFAQVHLHWIGDPNILCHPLLLLPSIFPSIRVFSTESALRIRWPKYWSFSFSIRREWQAIAVFLLWEPHELYFKKRQYDNITLIWLWCRLLSSGSS